MAFVTRSNWKETSAEAKSRIEEATFVAVDLELSGVQTTQWRAATEVDSLHTRYLNLRDSADKFAVLQVGVCPFVWDAAHSKFLAHPYNFCVFPRDELPVDMPARDFLCQASSLDFLSKHHFDFNACIYDGVSYLSREEEAFARSRLGLTDEGALAEMAVAEIPLTKTGDVLFSESVRVQAGQWRDKMLHRNENEAGTYLVVEVSGSHQANLVHQVLRKYFHDLVPLTEPGTKKVKVALPRSTKERAALQREWEKEKRKRMEAQVMDAVGFRNLIDVLVESRKPLVGHNCFLDFAHIYSKFFAPLPLSCTDFCSSLHQHFPWIFDTKYLLKTDSSVQELLGERCSTTLGVVYAHLDNKLQSNKAVVELGASGRRYAGSSDRKHEAGYDAYITGIIFANICQILRFDPASLLQLPAAQGLLPGYANLLYLGWLSQFVLDLTTGREATGGKSLKMHRQQQQQQHKCDRAALLWGCSNVTDDVEKQLVNCFSSKADVELVSIDDDSAFAVFKRKECLELLVTAFETETSTAVASASAASSSSSQCDVKALVSRGLKIARFDLFERLCRSPLSTPKLTDAVQLLPISDPDRISRKRPRL